MDLLFAAAAAAADVDVPFKKQDSLRVIHKPRIQTH